MAEDWSRPVVHWELQAKDPDRITEFYSKLCNWQIGEGMIRNISAGIGAPEPITGHIRQSDRSGVTLYIQVLSLQDALAKVRDMGGKVTREPFDPGGRPPTLAWIEDPEGNHVVLVQQ